MNGNRKTILGTSFLACCTFIAYAALTGTHEPDLIGLSTFIGAMAGGMFGVVWGNVKEHQAKANGTQPIR